MSQTESKQGTANRAIADAINALKNQFEAALIAEWDIETDAAKVRNAMQVLPNRCVQCKKRPEGFGGDPCTCKPRPKYERCLVNPRNTLLELLRQRCRGVSTSRSLAEFVEQITRIGVANGRNLVWVKGQIRGLRRSLSRVCRMWIIGVCPPPFRDTGQLPQWFKDDGEIVGDNSSRGLSSEESEAELALIEAGIEEYFEAAKSAALDQATIQMAQVDRERMPRKRARQDITAAVIARIKRDNPGESIEWICQQLDDKKCPLRGNDQRAGFSSWHAIWKDPTCRNRIKRFISAIQPAAAERKV